MRGRAGAEGHVHERVATVLSPTSRGDGTIVDAWTDVMRPCDHCACDRPAARNSRGETAAASPPRARGQRGCCRRPSGRHAPGRPTSTWRSAREGSSPGRELVEHMAMEWWRAGRSDPRPQGNTRRGRTPSTWTRGRPAAKVRGDTIASQGADTAHDAGRRIGLDRRRHRRHVHRHRAGPGGHRTGVLGQGPHHPGAAGRRRARGGGEGARAGRRAPSGRPDGRPRDDAGHQRHHRAQGGPNRPRDHARLSRRPGDGEGAPVRPLRPLHRVPGAAGAAPVADGRGRAHRPRRRGPDPARRAGHGRRDGPAPARRRRIGGGVPPALVRQPRQRAGGRADAAAAGPRPPGLPVVPGAARGRRVRPGLDHGGQRLRAAPRRALSPRSRRGPRPAGIARRVLRDELGRRHAQRGRRSRVPGAPGRVRAGRGRLRGHLLCRARGHAGSPGLRHGRHHGQDLADHRGPADAHDRAGGGAGPPLPEGERPPAQGAGGGPDRDRRRRREHRAASMRSGFSRWDPTARAPSPGRRATGAAASRPP